MMLMIKKMIVGGLLGLAFVALYTAVFYAGVLVVATYGLYGMVIALAALGFLGGATVVAIDKIDYAFTKAMDKLGL